MLVTGCPSEVIACPMTIHCARLSLNYNNASPEGSKKNAKFCSLNIPNTYRRINVYAFSMHTEVFLFAEKTNIFACCSFESSSTQACEGVISKRNTLTISITRTGSTTFLLPIWEWFYGFHLQVFGLMLQIPHDMPVSLCQRVRQNLTVYCNIAYASYLVSINFEHEQCTSPAGISCCRYNQIT